jgi:hypothetical protein
MKIVDEKMDATVSFCDLSPGTVFFFPAEGWYGIPFKEPPCSDNAVDLQTGELASLADWDQVVPLKDAHLVI